MSYHHPKRGKTQHNAFLRVALETQHNAFLRVALWGGNSVLQRICRNSHRFNIEIQILVGLVMAPHGSFDRSRYWYFIKIESDSGISQ
ncbi:hypothetical protein MAL08_01985 [Leptospira noguchii]|uniref:hypothetical protein n=1 Tax=Leptospira noguchii TaxID=28182 RepID=UPI001FB83580|nr:hypothetical protein [Leptospira noguchii]UOG38158.1 hypothetical protein MAL08_01985 [Leptospira noguchii]